MKYVIGNISAVAMTWTSASANQVSIAAFIVY